MRETTTRRGQRAESLAATYLEGLGYRIVARNFHARGGEIDIIAFDGEVLCFVEVRSRQGVKFGTPLETIDRRKIRRVATAARSYLEKLERPWPRMRFDAVGIVMSVPPNIELVRDAFEAG
ncbi:MAG: YraN family protein [Deltaproteobacteria bacterium RIFOXYA12_FULL_58_15]|nr:MAG: YraN family protein [Deltaproteobacteria bacterium RIFOXYA12_FULL_58_15]OGR09113.1 MAG: YraN family protein [Deltaproteobacteria bacterium RIFOXYB12_FULL_58_9]